MRRSAVPIRSRNPRRRRILAALSLCVLACASRNHVSPGWAGGTDVREIVLFPLNVVVALPSGLEGATGPVEQELRTYLEAQGKRVEIVPLVDAQTSWLETARALKLTRAEEQMSFEGAAAFLARGLRTKKSFDVLLIPWIALRPAKARGRSVSWDGVVRTLGYSEASDSDPGYFYHFGATMVAPSLQVTAFSPEGAKVFEGTGGLDLTDEVTIDRRNHHIDIHPRKQLFADPMLLREGVALALEPFLPVLPAASR